jgi:ABC-type sugar transport system ATPase subunit
MLELRGIGKRFPGVQALDEVSLSFAPGEIHALVGENGAGKSTLIKIIIGLYRPDAGEVLFEGRPLRFRNTRDSLARGIDVVSQEIQVIPESTIAENMMLDKLITRGRTGIIDWPAVERTARRYLDLVGLPLPPDTVIKRLSAAHKQLVQIAKALAAEARVLLLDEPTSSLTEHEARNLFALLRGLRDKGVTIIFVSHKLEEVFALCDRVSVLRDGRLVGTRPIAGLTRPEIVTMMIGRDVTQAHLAALTRTAARRCSRAEASPDRADRGRASPSARARSRLLRPRRRRPDRAARPDQRPLDAANRTSEGKPIGAWPQPGALPDRLVTENRKEEGLSWPLRSAPTSPSPSGRGSSGSDRAISRTRELRITRA